MVHGGALATFEDAARIDPRDPSPLSSKGAALIALRRHGEAAEAFDRALRASPHDVDAAGGKRVALAYLRGQAGGAFA